LRTSQHGFACGEDAVVSRQQGVPNDCNVEAGPLEEHGLLTASQRNAICRFCAAHRVDKIEAEVAHKGTRAHLQLNAEPVYP
jgi:hypothetical protein